MLFRSILDCDFKVGKINVVRLKKNHKVWKAVDSIKPLSAQPEYLEFLSPKLYAPYELSDLCNTNASLLEHVWDSVSSLEDRPIIKRQAFISVIMQLKMMQKYISQLDSIQFFNYWVDRDKKHKNDCLESLIAKLVNSIVDDCAKRNI